MLDTIIYHIKRTHDISTNNTERRESFEILQQYQTETFNVEHMFIFLKSNNSSDVKMFGLKCFEHLILCKWNNSPKDKCKEIILQIVRDYQLLEIDSCYHRSVCWIISKCVMYYVRHECPQHCLDLVDGLISLANGNIYLVELVVSIFLCLSESIPSENQMPEKRKKEVVSYLNGESHKIISFCLHNIKLDNAYLIGILNDISICIDSYCNWVNIDNLKSGLSLEIIVKILQSLTGNSTDLCLLTILETIITRKGRPDERLALLASFTSNSAAFQHLIQILKCYLKTPIPSYSEETFRCIQKSVDVLIGLANCILTNYNTSLNAYLVELLNVCVLATVYPIKIISVEMLSFWTGALKTDVEAVSIAFKTNHICILDLLKLLSHKVDIHDKSNDDYAYLINLIDEDDLEAFSSKIRFETSQILGSLTRKFTNELLAYAMQWTNQMLTPDANQSIESIRAAYFFLKTCVHSVIRPHNKSIAEQLAQILSSTDSTPVVTMALTIIDCLIIGYPIESINPEMAICIAEFICCLFPFAGSNDNKVQLLIEKVFTLYSHAQTMDNKQWRQVSMTASVAILRIFRDFHFLISTNLFECIVQFNFNQSTPIYYRSVIVEALVIYIRQSANYSLVQQTTLLSQLLQPIGQVLMSEECQMIFAGPDQLIEFLHMDRSIPTGNLLAYPSEHSNTIRENIFLAVLCLLSIVKRIQDTSTSNTDNDNETILIKATNFLQPALLTTSQDNQPNNYPINPQFLLQLLPKLLNMLKTLNYVWTSANLHGDYSDLKAMTKIFRELIIKKKLNYIKPAPSEPDYYFSIVRHFISSLPDMIWPLLGKYCSLLFHRLYLLDDWPVSINQYVFANLESIPDFKLKEMINRLLIPFVLNCPENRYSFILEQVILPFSKYMFTKLTEQWRSMSSSMNDIQSEMDDDNNYQLSDINSDDNNLHDEIIQVQIITNVSRSFTELIKLLLTIQSPDNSPTNPFTAPSSELKLGQICQHGNQNEMLLQLLCNCCQALNWRDSDCCRRISLLIVPLINKISQNGSLNMDVVLFVFNQLISTLNIFTTANYVEIRTNLLNIALVLYQDYVVHFNDGRNLLSTRILNKSTDTDFQMLDNKLNDKVNNKTKRDALEILLRPYIGVPLNQMFSQSDVFIKNLAPILKADWRKQKVQTDLSECFDLFNN